MSNSYDEFGTMIRKLVKDLTRYNVPRLGQVSKIKDDKGLGRILVLIQSLGWSTNDQGAWCYPKDKKSIITPAIDDFVIVEFIDGDMNFPIYTGIATQMQDMLPSGYDKQDTTQVLFENRAKNFSVIYDENEELLTLGAGDESYIKGDTAKPELQKNIDALAQLQTDLNLWSPIAGDGGAALKAILIPGFLTNVLASLTNILSERIKGE